MSTASKISGRTTILWGRVKAPVALFKTTGDTKEKDFERAGPNGKPLVRFSEWKAKKDAEARATFAETLAETPDPLAAAPAEPPAPEQETHFEPKTEGELGSDPEAARAQAIAYAELTGQLLVEEGSEELVLPEEVRHGVRVGEDFIDVTDRLEEIRDVTMLDEMRIVSFIRIEQVPRARIKGSYYLGHDAPGSSKLLKALYVAMRGTGRAAVVKWTKTSRQALGILRIDPMRKALVVLEVEWAENWREPADRVTQFQLADLTDQEVAVAEQLVHAMADSVASLDELRDDAREKREELRERAESGKLEAFEPPERTEASDGPLEDALRDSVGV